MASDGHLASSSGRDHRLPANATRAWSDRDRERDTPESIDATLENITRVASSPATSTPIPHESHVIRRRRSSVAERLSAIGDIGGVNSFNNFARSWQRAAGFHEFPSGTQSFRVQPDVEGQDEDDLTRSSGDQARKGHRSLLRAALENDGRSGSESALEEDATAPLLETSGSPENPVERRIRQRRSSLRQEGLLQLDPALDTLLPGSYGSFLSRASASSLRPSRTVIAPAIESDLSTAADGESEPMLGKQTEQSDQDQFNAVVGGSTVPQTIFNSANTLIGVGMLSLPLAVRYSGWVFGLGFFLFASVATSYTAKLLAKCMDVDGSLITFADLAYVSFGTNARIATSILFCLELIASCVALVILFADSMNALVEPFSILDFKILCGLLLIPLAFVPLRFLSFSSVLGIVCCAIIVVAVFADGMLKPDAPGSLRSPATTYAYPADWRTLPLAFGLLMAPWGGHGVFPNIYRDMRHPQKYGFAVDTTYIFTFAIEVVITIIGYLMFGEAVRDEVTSSLFMTPGYPRWLNYVVAIAICIIPLTKAPLNARPIYSTVEFFFGLSNKRPLHVANRLGATRSDLWRKVLMFSLRIIITIVFVVVAIFVPGFDRVMALMGSLACSLVCVVLPCSFHLKIFGKQLSWKQKCLDWFLILLFMALGIVGTVSACLPKNLLGIDD